MPRIVLKCAPGGTIWTILGEHLENRVFKPKNSILFGVPRIIMKSAPGGTVWTISGERLENARFEPQIQFLSGVSSSSQ